MAATSVGEIGLDLVVNQNQFKRQMSGVTSMAKKAGAALAAAFAVKKLVDFGKQCVELGSDLAEVQNVVDVTFPNMTAKVDEFAKSAAASFGLSETMAKKYTGTFGAMAKAFGFSESAAYDMGSTLTGLAGDIASFYNITQDEAYTKLKSVFTGETETLKDLGVVMTQNALDAYAMANGYGKTTQAMTEAEKVALRYAFVQQQLSASSGDFARTSGSWANQVRILKLQFESLKATIGQGLINVFTPVIKIVNTLLGKLSTLANAFKSFTELITGNKSSGQSSVSGGGIGDVASAASDAGAGLSDAASSAGNLAGNTSDVGNAAKKAAKEMRSLMGFDQINKLSDNSTDDTDSSTPSGGGSGSGGASLGDAVDYGSIAEGETVVDKLDSKFMKFFENIKKSVQPTVDSLKRLWNEGLAKFGNFAWTALKDFYDGFLIPVGKWVFGEGIPRFIDALNNGLMRIDFQKINDALRGLWNVLTPFTINVGEGLLWFWENVLVPLGTWVANEVVPRFLETLTKSIDAVNKIIEALKPLFEWFWENVLKPLAEWTGGVFLSIWDKIIEVLGKFADWCGKNPGIIQEITVTLAAFFAAWKITEMLSFIQQSGGVIAAIKGIATALSAATTAKIADKAETIALTAMYAKDFVVSVGQGVSALAKQAAQFVITTAAKVADTVAQVAMTAATVAWNAVCTLATVATTALGAAFAFLTSPIGLVVLAIGAVIAAGVAIYKNWDTIKEKATELWTKITEVFEGIKNSVSEKLEAVKASVREKFNAVKETMETVMQAAKDTVSEKLQNMKQAYDEHGGGIKGIVHGAMEGIKGYYTAGYSFLCKLTNGKLQSIVDTAENKMRSMASGISSKLNGIKDAFSSVFNAVKGTVSSVFNGMWNIIRSVINSILGGVERMVNGVISGVNSIARAFNSMNIDIPDWVPGIGGGTLGFNLPTWSGISLPRLAQGGYVKPNTPQLAMIGDNRHQGEVVAPEDKMQEMVNAAVRAVAGSGGVSKAELESIINNAVMRIVAALGQMGFFLDGQLMAKALVKATEDLNYRENPVKII